MISFLSTNYIFVNKLYFPHNLLIYDSVFCIYDLHSYYIIFKNILSSSCYIFFPSSFSSSFHLFPHFPFAFFSFPYFLFFFLCPNLYHFLNLVRHFLRTPLPCSHTFCCPVGTENKKKTFLARLEKKKNLSWPKLPAPPPLKSNGASLRW